MSPTPTVTIPLSTAEKLTQIGQAMRALAEEMKRHAHAKGETVLSFPIPDLTPSKTIPEDQAWLWKAEWQQGEQAANEDIKAGRISKGFASVDELFAALDHQV
ncbi:MAG: hypothetical protein K8L97_20585 [Anaerolineae bacterium]|nr:hypothetical protein [Anaerolineae bacterium]